MADQNFSDVQAQMRSQMQTQVNDSELKEAVQEMNSATKNLNQTNVNQLQQSNALVQTLQQTQLQIQTLATNVQNLVNVQRMQGMQQPAVSGPPPPPAPQGGMMSAVGGIAHSGAGLLKGGAVAAGGAVMNQAEMARRNAIAASAKYNPISAQAQFGAMSGVSMGGSPGVITAPNQGMRHSAWAGMGGLYNPTMMQSMTFGQYTSAQARNFGTNIQDMGTGAVAGGLGLLTAENAGALGGGMLGTYLGGAIGTLGGPVGTIAGGMIGGMIGSELGAGVGRQADVVNPFLFGAQYMGQSTAFGAGANKHAGQFLRGAGGRRVGEFDLQQQAQIGTGLARDALKDLTFTTEDMTQMQSQFAEKGLNLGVQNARQYRQNFKKRMADAKEVMKMFNVSLDEATDFMAMEFGQMGLDAGATNMRTRVLASAHMSGMSPMQMAKIAAAGGAGAGQYGLMSSFGSGAALQASQLAGVSATMGGKGGIGVGTDLLSSVGGEDGLRQLIQSQVMKFMGGTGGTLMAFNKGGFGTDVMGALQNAGSGLNSDRMIEFAANRHRELSQFSPEMAQYQQFQMIKGIAGELESAGGSLEDRMKLVAQSQGLDSIQADALIQSGKAMPEQMRRKLDILSQQRTDMERDVRAEQFGIRGRIERGFRGGVERSGLLGGLDKVMTGMAEYGTQGEVALQELTDRFHGIDEIASYAEEGTKRLQETKMEEFLAPDQGSGPERARRKRRARIGRIAKEEFSRGTAISERVSEILEDVDPTTPEGKEQIRRAVKAMRSGDITDFHVKTGKGDVSATEIMEVVKNADLGEGKANEIAESFGYIDDAKEPKTVKSVESIANRGREMFLGERADGLGEKVVEDKDWMYAMQKTEFKEFMKLVDRMFNVREDGKGEARQPQEYRDLKAAAEAKLKSITDRRVIKVIERIMKKRGVDVSGGTINMSKAKSVNPSAHGFFENSFEVGLNETVGDIDSRRKVDAMKRGLKQFGISDEVLNESGQLEDKGRLQEGLRTFAQYNEDELDNMMSSGNEHQKYIAAMAKLSKAQPDRKFSKKQWQKLGYAMTMQGDVQGEVVSGEGIDETMVGAETIKGLKDVNTSLDATRAMLEMLAKDSGALK